MEIIANTTNMLIPLDDVTLRGDLFIPDPVIGLVIFSHGSGSSRMSTRNKSVAQVLQREGLATMLFDLLTPEEDLLYENRFDIQLLTSRLISVTHWLEQNVRIRHLNFGYFGASTGAASALNAAAYLGDTIRAVVSRGGRPDLAMKQLSNVVSPTLLLVGGNDLHVIELNKEAFARMECEKKLTIIPNASHLFEEPGKLLEVANHSAKWFKKWF